jgi:predicted nucleic acid-binding protein
VGLLKAVGAGPAALDTAPFIYLIEKHDVFLPVVEPVFAAIDGGRLAAVTSALTLLEVAVMPLRHGDMALARHYEALLSGSRGLELADISLEVVRDAAALRAATGVRTPDAIQLATALHRGCTSFVTNDRALPDLPGLRVLQIADFAARTGAAHGGTRRPPRVSER